MKYLLVIFLTGCTKQYIAVPVNSNQKEANCIVKVNNELFLTTCKEIKT
jgi:PBP1b-binding outer membrane lipoprotein LpoB